MRKFLVSILLVCFCLSMVACSENTIVREETSFQGTSDGTFSFTEGNIRFTVPSGQFYTISQNEVDSKDEYGAYVTVCLLGSGDSTTIISADPVDDLSESEIADKVSFWNEQNVKKFAKYTNFDDLNMIIMGRDVVFKTYLNENEDRPKFHMTTVFTDSRYIYRVEIQLPEITEVHYGALFEMLCSSEYIGPETRFDFFQ